MMELENKSVDYLLSVNILKKLRKQNLITQDEFEAIDRENKKSFKPR